MNLSDIPESKRGFVTALEKAFSENADAVFFELAKRRTPAGQHGIYVHFDEVGNDVDGLLHRAMAENFDALDLDGFLEHEDGRLAFIIERAELEFYLPVFEMFDVILKDRFGPE